MATRSTRHFTALGALIFAGLVNGAASTTVFAAPRKTSSPTALDRYVAKPDAAYTYRLVETIPGNGVTTYVLAMTSQQWLTEKEVNRPRWEHYLTIVKPAQVRKSTGLLMIGGGSNPGSPPKGADPAMAMIAAATGSVVAELKMVPNEPLTFLAEGRSRTEDGIIAYTWDHFLKTGDETWPLRLPMTKSAVRAMDTITAFCGAAEQGKTKVDRFVVSGGSKRGWTTWTTAAVDDRVVAIVPLVIDVLNVRESMRHHFRAYGFWAPAVGDYQAMRLMDRLNDPRWDALMKIEDPYSYRSRLTMPKFIVNAAGDQFFLPDSSQFYFDDLKGEKYLRYVPNTDHSLRNSDARESLAAFYEAILTGEARPRFTWKLERDSAIRVTAKDRPTSVKLWQANNPKARDFRLESIGPAYKSSNVEMEGEGAYVGRAEKPAAGWTAYFLELTYDRGAGKLPFKFTTPVRVIPDLLPHPDPAAKK